MTCDFKTTEITMSQFLRDRSKINFPRYHTGLFEKAPEESLL
jgi:hypothetical protein